MSYTTLGEAIRSHREKADLSLRDLAKKVGVSAPFLSDIELGRRYPADDKLVAMANALKVDVSELKKFDHRELVADFKRMTETYPKLGMLYRTDINNVNAGRMSPEELAKKLRGNG